MSQESMDETEDEVTPVKQGIPDLKMLDERVGRMSCKETNLKPPRSGKHALEEDFFNELSMQVGKWSHKNFGAQGWHRPAMGIVEELCELYEALEGSDQEKVSDAIGDTVIYMADYFYNRSWSLGDAWLERERLTNDTASVTLQLIGKLCHSHLKGEQGIRGGREKHDAAMKLACSRVLGLLDEIVEFHLQKSTVDIIRGVWDVVGKRDWTKNPDTAHEVAAAPVVTDSVQINLTYEVGDEVHE